MRIRRRPRDPWPCTDAQLCGGCDLWQPCGHTCCAFWRNELAAAREHLTEFSSLARRGGSDNA